MSDLTKFSDGASILQQVDVSSIFKNLAMGIAEAQQKLDDNSIAQAIKLAETQIGGVSLLELGFAPVFYAFQYADISASINLQMAMKNELEFGFGLSIELATKKGYSSEDRTFIGEDNYSETQSEYKSSAILTVRANSKKAVKIEGHSYTLDESLKAKSRIENFKEQVYENESNIEQIYDEIKAEALTEDKSRGVDVWVDSGYLRVEESEHHKASGVGILKITDYSGNPDFDLDATNTSIFDLGSDLETTLPDAATALDSGRVYGVSKSGHVYLYAGGWKKISSKFYFAYNRDEITYDEDLLYTDDEHDVTFELPVAPGYKNKNPHDVHLTAHRVLRLIQKNDPKATITITGVTDPKGGDNPNNQSLAKRRAEKLRGHIFGTGTNVNVVTAAMTNPSGGSDLRQRYAEVKLGADYIVFVNGTITKDATPTKTEDVENKFVYADDAGTGAFNKLDVKFGANTLAYSLDTNDKTMATLVQYVKGAIRENTHEKINERNYFLEDESVVKFYLYNSKSEDIKVEIDEESNSEGTQNTNTWMASKTKNQKSLLSDSASKKSKDNSFALGASVDFRLSRQFEMTMEGNSAMSARLVAAPAPAGFLAFVQNVFNSNTEE